LWCLGETFILFTACQSDRDGVKIDREVATYTIEAGEDLVSFYHDLRKETKLDSPHWNVVGGACPGVGIGGYGQNGGTVCICAVISSIYSASPLLSLTPFAALHMRSLHRAG